jgi:plastocyanin
VGGALIAAGTVLLVSDRVEAQDSATTGRIEGTAAIAARLSTQHTRVRVYAEPGGRAVAPQATDNPIQQVVIYLEGASAETGENPAGAAMRQHNERFVPHVLAVPAGSTVEFPNDDPIFHSVFSLSRAKSFDLGRYPQGESKRVTFARPGVVPVFCHIHADMSGFIVVLANRFFTIPDSAGHFVIAGIPSGEYRLTAWHERIRPISRMVQVEAGAVTDVRLAIPLEDLPATP